MTWNVPIFTKKIYFLYFFVNIGKFEFATDSYIVRLNHKLATVAEALIYAKLHVSDIHCTYIVSAGVMRLA